MRAPLTRREMLCRSGMGMGALALAPLLAQSGYGAEATNPMAPKAPHFPVKAKHFVHIFMNGGLSQVDTFDPKPALQKYAGQKLPMENLKTERKTGVAFPSPYKFKKHGQSGIEVSDIFPYTAECVDEMTVIRSMYADLPDHGQSVQLMHTGDPRFSRPSMGAWLSYGLGTENQGLPGFIALSPGNFPIQLSPNWQSSFLPGVHQGTYVETNKLDGRELIRHLQNHQLGRDEQRRMLDLTQQMNQLHAQERSNDHPLEVRIRSFEMAYRMQQEAAEAFDISKEPKHILEMYGTGEQATQMLIARRLIERGVRVLQLWPGGGGMPWDHHHTITPRHRSLAKECDQAIGALLKDLKQRGLLDETLVLCCGEFGRTPVVEGSELHAGSGRDHNHWGFTAWLAGGGVKKGHIHGATDEFGFAAVEDRMHVHDLHATILRLMGFDHERLTFRVSGRDYRLTDVYGRVAHEIIA